MNSLAQRILLNKQSVYRLNGLNELKLRTKCVRQMHLLKMYHTSLPPTHFTLLASTQSVYKRLNTIVYTPKRQKYDRKNPTSSNDESDDDQDDDDNNLDEFREGKTDRVTQIKVQTLRLDSVIKAGLGLSKKSIEKLFYDSKIRVNGKKITKKSMDITGKCEIDVIKGASPDNSDFLIVGRIEVLAVKADGLNFTLTVRRNKNLTIENYAGGAQFAN